MSSLRSDVRAGTVGLVAALVLFAIFLFAYAGALHDPQPHRVPLGILNVRPSSRVHLPRSFVVRAETPATFRDDILDRRVAGGVSDGTLYVAGAASFTTAQYLQAALKPRKTIDLRPLPPGDSRGITLFYTAIALVFAGYFAATVITTLVRPASPTHVAALLRLGGLAAFSLCTGLVGAAIVSGWTGGFWAIAAVGALTVFATGAATAALQSLLGLAGTLVAMVLFVMLGNSSSGGAYQRSFTPGFWSSIGAWLPTGASVSALRAGVYFDWRASAGRLLVLAGYGLAGAAVTILLGRRRGRRASELELALAAGSA